MKRVRQDTHLKTTHTLKIHISNVFSITSSGDSFYGRKILFSSSKKTVTRNECDLLMNFY